MAKTAALTSLAMLAFAANSLLCRMALEQQHIDAASFTFVRILAGAAILVPMSLLGSRAAALAPPDWRSIGSLFCYMVFFSFAYVTLGAATGALLMFGAVQLTMFTAAIRGGERLPPAAWAGLIAAFSGLIYLVAPGVTAPEPVGAVLMVVAGISWGAYSLAGRRAEDPLQATATNFVYAVPLSLIASLVFLADLEISVTGAMLAAASGALASGLGYAIWYAALSGLAASQAATVQLSVPVIAAAGGILLLSEDVTLRLGISSALTIGGIYLVLTIRTTRSAAAEGRKKW